MSADKEKSSGGKQAVSTAMQVGWVTGWEATTGSGIILHTGDGGKNWTRQGSSDLLAGYSGNDISAVDEQTAWAALGSKDLKHGRIIFTSNGKDWEEQALPEGVDDVIKGIKGLSRDEAWAATLGGIILHTTNGGKFWNVVFHPDIEIKQVNRIDANAEGNVWIADTGGGKDGLIHSLDGGANWRKETLPNPDSSKGPIGVSAFSSSVVWSAISLQGDMCRTIDGGEKWNDDAPGLAGPFDFDDICATGTNTVWAVLNRGGHAGGTIFHVTVTPEGVDPVTFSPLSNYEFEGLTCASDNEVCVVGYKSTGADPGLPEGIILSTTDGGENWGPQVAPVCNAKLWKVSFVGAYR